MIEQNVVLKLPEGNFPSKVLTFEQKDLTKLASIYKNWRGLCDELENIGARKVNLPEGLSESAFCLAKGMVRLTKSISSANTSFDAYDPNGEVNHNRIQIKACSVLPDLTSFGPKSVWDRIFFVDFYREGNWDGTFDIYEMNTNDIYNQKVNATQTLREQQLQNRRPRFSLYKELILNGKYISKETFKLDLEIENYALNA